MPVHRVEHRVRTVTNSDNGPHLDYGIAMDSCMTEVALSSTELTGSEFD
jgi:hypothetical protein